MYVEINKTLTISAKSSFSKPELDNNAYSICDLCIAFVANLARL